MTVECAPDAVEGPYIDLAYIHDGSLEGLLSAIFQAYVRHENPTDVVAAERYVPRLGQYAHQVETSEEEALRVRAGLCRACGDAAFEAVRDASLSDEASAHTAIYRFVRYAMKRGRGALSDVARPEVAPLTAAARAVRNERHRMLQFLRFEHLENDVWFARCKPNASVVPLVMDWFVGRFNVQPFIIYDETHKLAGVYGGQGWHLVQADELALPGFAPDECAMQQAWRRFYRSVSVESRYNPELRRGFMPKRLWETITEMREDVEGFACSCRLEPPEGERPAEPRMSVVPSSSLDGSRGGAALASDPAGPNVLIEKGVFPSVVG